MQAFIHELSTIELPVNADSELHKVLGVLLNLAEAQAGALWSAHLTHPTLPKCLIAAAVQAWLSSRFVLASACLVAARWVRCYQQATGGGQPFLHATRALCEGMHFTATLETGGMKTLSMARDTAHAVGPLALSIPDYSNRRLGSRQSLQDELRRLKPCSCVSS